MTFYGLWTTAGSFELQTLFGWWQESGYSEYKSKSLINKAKFKFQEVFWSNLKLISIFNSLIDN